MEIKLTADWIFNNIYSSICRLKNNRVCIQVRTLSEKNLIKLALETLNAKFKIDEGWDFTGKYCYRIMFTVTEKIKKECPKTASIVEGKLFTELSIDDIGKLSQRNPNKH